MCMCLKGLINAAFGSFEPFYAGADPEIFQRRSLAELCVRVTHVSQSHYCNFTVCKVHCFGPHVYCLKMYRSIFNWRMELPTPGSAPGMLLNAIPTQSL